MDEEKTLKHIAKKVGNFEDENAKLRRTLKNKTAEIKKLKDSNKEYVEVINEQATAIRKLQNSVLLLARCGVGRISIIQIDKEPHDNLGLGHVD